MSSTNTSKGLCLRCARCIGGTIKCEGPDICLVDNNQVHFWRLVRGGGREVKIPWIKFFSKGIRICNTSFVNCSRTTEIVWKTSRRALFYNERLCQWELSFHLILSRGTLVNTPLLEVPGHTINLSKTPGSRWPLIDVSWYEVSRGELGEGPTLSPRRSHPLMRSRPVQKSTLYRGASRPFRQSCRVDPDSHPENKEKSWVSDGQLLRVKVTKLYRIGYFRRRDGKNKGQRRRL